MLTVNRENLAKALIWPFWVDVQDVTDDGVASRGRNRLHRGEGEVVQKRNGWDGET